MFFSHDNPVLPKNRFFYGWVAYLDLFGNPHLTEFCYQFHFGQPPATDAKRVIVWSQCETHNCVDRDCREFDMLTKAAEGVREQNRSAQQ